MTTSALIPRTVNCAGIQFQGVQLSDGRLAVTLASICAALGLQRFAQHKRILRSPLLAAACLRVPIDTPGGVQPHDVLLEAAFPLWLAGLQEAQRSPETRERLYQLQAYAIKALQSTFSDQPKRVSTPLGVKAPKSQSLSAVLAQAGDIIDSRFEAIESAQALLSSLLTELVASLPADMVAPSGTIAPMRLPHIYALAGRVRQSYGVPIVETLTLLAEHFHVEDVSDLPAAAWPAVLDWFKGYLLTGYPPGA